MKSFLSTLPLLLLGCSEPETRTSMIVQVEADDPQVLLQLANQLALTAATPPVRETDISRMIERRVHSAHAIGRQGRADIWPKHNE